MLPRGAQHPGGMAVPAIRVGAGGHRPRRTSQLAPIRLPNMQGGPLELAKRANRGGGGAGLAVFRCRCKRMTLLKLLRSRAAKNLASLKSAYFSDSCGALRPAPPPPPCCAGWSPSPAIAGRMRALISGDDLAFAAMHDRRCRQLAGAAAQHARRPALGDGAAAAAAPGRASMRSAPMRANGSAQRSSCFSATSSGRPSTLPQLCHSATMSSRSADANSGSDKAGSRCSSTTAMAVGSCRLRRRVEWRRHDRPRPAS